MGYVTEIKRTQASEGDEIVTNYKELAEVYADILDRLCNDLWQLVHPGAENNFSSVHQVLGDVKAELARLNQELDEEFGV